MPDLWRLMPDLWRLMPDIASHARFIASHARYRVLCGGELFFLLPFCSGLRE
jgi:hypothetical protein